MTRFNLDRVNLERHNIHQGILDQCPLSSVTALVMPTIKCDSIGTRFLSPPVRMHGGLICVAFCMSVTRQKVKLDSFFLSLLLVPIYCAQCLLNSIKMQMGSLQRQAGSETHIFY